AEAHAPGTTAAARKPNTVAEAHAPGTTAAARKPNTVAEAHAPGTTAAARTGAEALVPVAVSHNGQVEDEV
ncbi:hypothetical protein ACGFY5_17465, partial [Cryptosporangium sp. NPDC048952]